MWRIESKEFVDVVLREVRGARPPSDGRVGGKKRPETRDLINSGIISAAIGNCLPASKVFCCIYFFPGLRENERG